MKPALLTVLSIVALLTFGAVAAEPAQGPPAVTLKVGDAAPPLEVGKWLRGGPIERLEPGTVYIVEFWATWCGPCRAMPPHLSAIAAKYKDQGVRVISVDIFERDPSALEPFMKQRGEQMKYNVATDAAHADEPGKMATAWMAAAGLNSIPHAFLIDAKGKIAWIGYPMLIGRPLEAVLAGKFDPAEQAKFEAQDEALSEELNTAANGKDYAAALAVLDRMIARNPDMSAQYDLHKINVLMRKGDYAAANKLAAELAAGPAVGNDFLQGTLAGTLLSAPEPDKVDHAVTLKLAQAVYQANGSEGWQYQNLLASALAADQQYDKAAEMQAKVVEGCPPQYKPRMQALLDHFKEQGAAAKK